VYEQTAIFPAKPVSKKCGDNTFCVWRVVWCPPNGRGLQAASALSTLADFFIKQKMRQTLLKKLLAWDKNLVKFAKYIFV
jgi:hypothetical protein